jgi:hypothetical protein
MAIKLCHHIKEDGIWCGSAALHGRDYCYAHLTFRGRRMRAAQQKRKHAWRLELPLLEDLNAVQVAIMQVLDAITEHRIDRHDAGQLLYGLQNAASNLRGEQRASFEVSPSAENRCVSYDSFEEDYGLVEDETSVGEKPDSAAAEVAARVEVAPAVAGQQAETHPPLLPTTVEPGVEPVAAKKEAATEAAEDAAPSPIIIDKLMAVAEGYPADSPAGAYPALTDVREAPRKPPRGLRPPKAVRQSAEEAAALAGERRAMGGECGRLENGEIVPCTKCEAHVYKRLAQFWDARNHPPYWLPVSRTMACDDCNYKRMTTMERHRGEPIPALFLTYIKAKGDGGEDPGDFNSYLSLLGDIEETGLIPDAWSERLRKWREQDGDSDGDAGDEESGEEETKASA